MSIDFVYGNFPIQPNAGRTDPIPGRVWDSRGSDGPEDAPPPAPTGSPTLDPALDNHAVVTTEYNGYPNNTPSNNVPDVVGETVSMAKLILERAGFKFGDVTTAAEGEWTADSRVETQTVAAGTMSPLRTVVGISTVVVEDPEESEEPEEG